MKGSSKVGSLKTKRLKRTSLLRMKSKNNSDKKKSKINKDKQQNLPSNLNVDSNREMLLVKESSFKRNGDLSNQISCACHSCWSRSILQQQHYQQQHYQQQIRNEELKMMYKYQEIYIRDYHGNLSIKTNKIYKTKPTNCYGFHQHNMVDFEHFQKRYFSVHHNPLYLQPGCYSMTSSVDSNTSDIMTSQQQSFITSQQMIKDNDFYNFVNF